MVGKFIFRRERLVRPSKAPKNRHECLECSLFVVLPGFEVLVIELPHRTGGISG